MRSSFGKFKEIGVSGKQDSYTIDVVAENLLSKHISSWLEAEDYVVQNSGYFFLSNSACSVRRHP
jgi:hypothetical protein